MEYVAEVRLENMATNTEAEIAICVPLPSAEGGHI